jgi:hypothetical protein
MGPGLPDGEVGKPDIELWLDHQKEIEFMLRVHAGLGFHEVE